jgi:lipopolysaccharide transport system ATP-binding protein
MDQDLAVKAEGICKKYILGTINHGTLYRDLQSWVARLRGRPDPNSVLSDEVLHAQQRSQQRGTAFEALSDVSFEVKRGDITGVVGRNGAGKSTLLKVISRITAPSSGRISLRGRVASLLEVGTGFHPELTGRENVYLNGAILGMRRDEVSRKFDEIVNFAEIEQFIDTPVKRYSSGMYVRLAFSVAAHLESEILLVDEVLAVGDINFQKKCMARMQDVGTEGRTIIFVSHNLAAVRNLCTKGLVISGGRVLFSGEIENAINVYREDVEQTALPFYQRISASSSGVAYFESIIIKNEQEESVSSFDISETILIEIKYRLGRQMKGVSINIIVVDRSIDTNIILSSDAESNPELMGVRDPGVFGAVVEIPRRFLNSGAYRIRGRISAGSTHYDIVDDIVFDVRDLSGSLQFMGLDRKNALLYSRLKWTYL